MSKPKKLMLVVVTVVVSLAVGSTARAAKCYHVECNDSETICVYYEVACG